MTTFKLALLDRDGTINVKALEGDYITRPSDLQLLPGAGPAVAALNAAGVRVAVVTNQRGVALGRMSMTDVERVHERLSELLSECGAHVDDWYVCPHEHNACDCRKPAPGMLLAALEDAYVRPAEAVMIGDAPSDVEAGRRAGVRTLRLTEDLGSANTQSLESAVNAVLTPEFWA